jgi:hypothetical protein
MNRRITITAGIGEDRHGDAIGEPALSLALSTIRGKLAATFGGFTETEATGGWIDGNGRMVMEDSRRWIVLTESSETTSDEEAIAAARMVQLALNQQAVMVEVETVAATFVQAKPITTTA